MKRSLLFLSLLFFALSCSDEDKKSSCDVANPVEDLEWLRNELEDGNYGTPTTHADYFVYQALYLGQPVFYISTCCPTCNMLPPSVKNCNGDILGSLGLDIDSDHLQDQVIIWRTHNGVCP
jgi:hypothetical protein